MIAGRYLIFLLLLSSCTCSKPIAPDRYAVEHLVDPYDSIPAQGQVPNEFRAAAAIDSIAKQLHYGSVPADEFKARSMEPWNKLLVLMLASGDRPQVKAAWLTFEENLVSATNIPVDARFRAREGQARLWDMENAHADEEVLKLAYLAEIAWCLQGMATIKGDGGSR